MEDWENQNLGALLDPFGINTNSHVTRYWTVAEQNSQTVSFSGLILWNRLLWMGVGLLSLLFTFWKFDFNLVGNASKKQKKKALKAVETNTIEKAATVKIPSWWNGLYDYWLLLRTWRNV